MSDVQRQAPANATQPLTVPLSDVAIEPRLFTTQPAYPLTESESLRLERGQRLALSWSANIFLTGVGAVIAAVAPAMVQLSQSRAITVDRTQLAIAIATMILSGVVWAGLKCIPGEYEKTMRKIKKFFKDNPPKPQIGGWQ